MRFHLRRSVLNATSEEEGWAMRRQRQIGRLLAGMALVAISACGGGGGGNDESNAGPTRLTGRVVLPDSSNCLGCSSGAGIGSEDANGDGKRSLIIEANVSAMAGIGGIDSVAVGSTTRQDYNPN